jgi:hypothetical protein
MAELIAISERIDDLVDVLRVVRGCGVPTMAMQTPHVAQRALRSYTHTERLVLFLTERDNLADLRAVLAAATGRVLLIAPRSPPSAALARVAAELGAGLLGRDDPATIREATLVAFASGRPHAAVS